VECGLLSVLGNRDAVVKLRAQSSPKCSSYGAAVRDKGREIRCYDYVKHPYQRVRDALKRDALTVFQSATKTADSRAQTVAAELRVDFGGIGMQTDINIVIKSVDERVPGPSSIPATRLRLEWEAGTMPRFFPLMKGIISLYPLTSSQERSREDRLE
jgi:hypothetical protein